MEVGLYPTPGIESIRSTSFYGLSFVRVTFKYGIDYYFAYTRRRSAFSRMSPSGEPGPTNPASSLVGESTATRSLAHPILDLPSAHRAGLGRHTSPVHGSGRRRDQLVGRHNKEFEVEADLEKLEPIASQCLN